MHYFSFFPVNMCTNIQIQLTDHAVLQKWKLEGGNKQFTTDWGTYCQPGKTFISKGLSPLADNAALQMCLHCSFIQSATNFLKQEVCH